MIAIITRHVIAEVLLQLDRQAPIDDQSVTCDEGSFVAAKEVNGVGDVIGYACAPHRILCFKHLQGVRIFLPMGFDSLGDNVPRANGIDANPHRAKVNRHLLGRADHR